MITRKSINGEMLTLEEAYEKHKHLIFKQANKFIKRGKRDGHEIEDLENMGFFGFMKAYEDFDPERGYRFSTYAVPKIFGAISYEVNRRKSYIHYQQPIKDNAVKYKRLGHKKVSAPLIMEALNIDYELAYEVFMYILNQNPSSIEEPLKSANKKDDGAPILVEDAIGNVPEFLIDETYALERRLTEKQRYVFIKLLEGYTPSEIARIKKCSRQAVDHVIHGIRKKYKKIEGVS
jgi:RNA polymerase sporulation-specific sigma factor